MTFNPYDYETAGHEIRIKDDGVYVAIRGSEEWTEDGYNNARNRTIEVKLPDDEVEQFVREYAGEVGECLENHPEWENEGFDACPVCGVSFSD